jgi:hypothetical protein
MKVRINIKTINREKMRWKIIQIRFTDRTMN